jgi:hypothetical protein
MKPLRPRMWVTCSGTAGMGEGSRLLVITPILQTPSLPMSTILHRVNYRGINRLRKPTPLQIELFLGVERKRVSANQRQHLR